jgi:hypothetical protein
VGLNNLGSELEKCVGSRIHLVGVSISFEKNFYRLPFTPPSLVRRIGPSATRCFDVGRNMLATNSQLRSQHVHYVRGGGRGRNMEKVFATWEKVFTTWKKFSQHGKRCSQHEKSVRNMGKGIRNIRNTFRNIMIRQLNIS